MGAGLKHHARLAVFLAFAAAAQFCFLNPQPEPPGDSTRTPTGPPGTGGSAGATGGGTGGAGIDPRYDASIGLPDGGVVGVPESGPAGDAARADVATEVSTDVGSADGADDATDGADHTEDGEDGEDAEDAAADGVAEGATDDAIDAALDVAGDGDVPEGAAHP